MARENFSLGAFYNITKNQDNPIKTVGRDSFLSPKTHKIQVLLGVTRPPGSHSPYILAVNQYSSAVTPLFTDAGYRDQTILLKHPYGQIADLLLESTM